jgi:hypothetical protein
MLINACFRSFGRHANFQPAEDDPVSVRVISGQASDVASQLNSLSAGPQVTSDFPAPPEMFPDID